MPVPTLTFLLTWWQRERRAAAPEENADQAKHEAIALARAALPEMAGAPVDAVLYVYLLGLWNA